MGMRLVRQYNGKWPIDLVYVSKLFITVIRDISIDFIKFLSKSTWSIFGGLQIKMKTRALQKNSLE